MGSLKLKGEESKAQRMAKVFLELLTALWHEKSGFHHQAEGIRKGWSRFGFWFLGVLNMHAKDTLFNMG